jgi:voltage-gated potassium channel Kch
MAQMGLSRAALARAWRWLRWRTLLILGVYVCALLAFELGVSASDRPGVEQAGFLAHTYYAAGLFVLGGMDLGMPVGGPLFGRILLWSAYFVAPIITAEALVEGVLQAIRPRHWELRRMRDHVVVAGCGKLSMQYLARLRQVHPRKTVVVVETRPDHPNLAEARDVYGAYVVIGDIDSDALLGVLRLAHADRVLLFTGEDFINLDSASKILQLAPRLGRNVIVHLGDLHFLRAIAGTRVAKECTFFNTHEIAAEHLVQTKLLKHFDRTEPLDAVVIAGFGRFGQTVLALLQKHAAGKFERVVVVDLECTLRTRLFQEQVGFDGRYQVDPVIGDLRDPELWKSMAERFGFDEGEPAFILGSGEDGTNLHAALRLKKKYPNAFVVARSFRHSAFAEDVAHDVGFEAFSVADLVAVSIRDEWLR